MSSIVPFEYSKHAEMVNKWASKHSFPIPAVEFLPKTGYLVNDAAVGFLYSLDSKLSWVEWIFSNPEKSPEDRSQALDLLFDTLFKDAKAKGYMAVFSSSNHKGYQSVLDRQGFVKTDTNITQYIKLLKEAA